MSAHPLLWYTPAPLWSRFGSGVVAAQATDQHRPALLRFATDDFVQQLLGQMASDPSQIGALLARPETWRTPMSDAPDAVERTPLPSPVRAAARLRLQKQAKTAVATVASTAQVSEKNQTRTLPLKLYQPVHQRYYLVGASLVCGVSGLPERVLVASSEQVGFVVRRLLPEVPGDATSALREFAYVGSGKTGRWQQPASDSDGLAAGEELLPLIPMSFRDTADRARTMWTGFVPVARREDYMGANVDRTQALTLAQAQLASLQPAAAAAPVNSITARKTQFMMEVAEPWKNLIRLAFKSQDSIGSPTPDGIDGTDNTPTNALPRLLLLNLRWQLQSWLILLDLADFLQSYLPDVYKAAQAGDGSALSGKPLDLYNWLAATTAMPSALTNAMKSATLGQLKPAKSSLREALASIQAFRDALEAAKTLYTETTYNAPDWPNFHFLLCGLDTAFKPSGAYATLDLLAAADPTLVEPDPQITPDVAADPQSVDAATRVATDKLDKLTTLVARCLVPGDESNAAPLPYAAQVRDAIAANAASGIGDNSWFVIRCVYRNADCGPLHAPTLSAPTPQFQMASFFDSDAPARPLRITLPRDTTPAGLRKHPRNTAFVISDALCGQLQRAKGMGFVDLVLSVLPWPFHKDLDSGDGGPCTDNGVNIGMICSLSLPIITLCAMLMLSIFISLLDIVFCWMPFFSFCFPVPKFDGKKS